MLVHLSAASISNGSSEMEESIFGPTIPSKKFKSDGEQEVPDTTIFEAKDSDDLDSSYEPVPKPLLAMVTR